MRGNIFFCKMQLLVALSAVLLISGCGSSSSSDSTPPDTTAPTAPTYLTAVAASDTKVSLRWSASTDNVGVTGYKIYRGSTQIGTTTETLYSNTGCTASSAYTYTVAAYDAAGNTSTPSSSASTTTLAPGTSDYSPTSTSATPSAPANLTATASSSSKISLSWSPSNDNIGVSGYNIYRATSASNTPTIIGTSTTTSYTDTGLTGATTYYYVVRAFDGYPNESLNSMQVSATTLQAP